MRISFDSFAPRQCCACGKVKKTVRNILMLDYKSPTPGGSGWGCLQCDLPMEGATAIVCDACLKSGIEKGGAVEPKWIVAGFVEDGKLQPIPEVKVPHEHNMALHPEVEAVNGH